MVEIGAISTLLSSIKTVQDIVSKYRSQEYSETEAEILSTLQPKILEAYESAISAQKNIYEQQQTIKELQSQIENLNDIQRKKDMYQLEDFGSETYVYVLKDEFSGESPKHKACPDCFHNDKIRILQFEGTTSAQQRQFVCKSCGNIFRLGTPTRPSQPRTQNTRSSWMAR